MCGTANCPSALNGKVFNQRQDLEGGASGMIQVRFPHGNSEDKRGGNAYV